MKRTIPVLLIFFCLNLQLNAQRNPAANNESAKNEKPAEQNRMVIIDSSVTT